MTDEKKVNKTDIKTENGAGGTAKKMKPAVKAVIIIGILALLTAVFFIFKGFFFDLYYNYMASNEAYLLYAEKNFTGALVKLGAVADSMDTFDYETQKICARGDFTYTDEFNERFGNKDGDVVKNGTLKAEINRNKDSFLLSVEGESDGENNINADIYGDFDGNSLILDLPDNSKKLVTVDYTMFGNKELSEVAGGEKIQYEAAAKVFEKSFLTLISKVRGVNKEDAVLEVNGIEMNCRKLSVTIRDKTVREAVIAFLKTLQNGEDFKALFEKNGTFCGMTYEEAQSALKEYRDIIEASGVSQVVGTYSVYVGKNGEVCGKTLEFNNTVAYYIMFVNGEKVAFDLSVNSGEYFVDNLSVKGDGEITDGSFAGKLSASYGGNALGTVDVEKIDVVKAALGKIDGKLIIVPDVGGIETTLGMGKVCTFAEKLSPTLKEISDNLNITVTVSKDLKDKEFAGTTEIVFADGDTPLVTLVPEIKTAEKTDFNLPDTTDAVVIDGETPFVKWGWELTASILGKKIEESGIKEKFENAVESVIEELSESSTNE